MIDPKASLKDLYRYPIMQEGRYGRLRLDKNENTIGFSPEVVNEMLSGITPEFLAAIGDLLTEIFTSQGVFEKAA